MKFRIPILISLLPALAGAQSLDPAALAAMERELEGYRAAHSVGYLGKAFFEVHTADGIEYGFGLIQTRHRTPRIQRTDYVVGFGVGPAPVDSARDYTVIFMNGRTYTPERTRKVLVNGIPGRPDKLGWKFEVLSGGITGFSHQPFGDPVEAVFQGRTFDLETRKGRKGLENILKRVPEAHARLAGGMTDAIRYFNVAPEGEFLPDTASLDQAGRTPATADRSALLPDNPGLGALDKRTQSHPNDLVALTAKAVAECATGKIDQAGQSIRAMEGIRPDYYGISLARARCLEEQAQWDQANGQLEAALNGERPDRLLELVDRMETNAERSAYVRAYAYQKSLPWWLELDAGLGLPQGMLGGSLAAHMNLGPLAASLAVGLGMGQFKAPHAGFPALSARLFLPGRKIRAYGGFTLMNPFRLGPKDGSSVYGPEVGLSHDIGKPRGFKLNYGIGSWAVVPLSPEPGRPLREVGFAPHFSIAHAF